LIIAIDQLKLQSTNLKSHIARWLPAPSPLGGHRSRQQKAGEHQAGERITHISPDNSRLS
jgi:hypothetical protein